MKFFLTNNKITRYQVGIFFTATALAFSLGMFNLPTAQAVFIPGPGPLLIDEQFETPASATQSGLGVFTTNLGYSTQLYGDLYTVLPAGSLPNGAHSNWSNPAIDDTGFFIANLAGFTTIADAIPVLKTTVDLTAGRTYRFTVNAATPISWMTNPNLGLVVNGQVMDSSGPVDKPLDYIVDYTATTSGPQLLELISLAEGDNGNDIMINYITLTEGILDEQSPLALKDEYTTLEKTAVELTPLTNDTDPENQPLAITKLNDTIIKVGDIFDLANPILTPNGVITIDMTGKIMFYPDSGFTGIENISYQIIDNNGINATSTISINVNKAPNILPVAIDDLYTNTHSKPLTLDPVKLDIDNDGTITLNKINNVQVVPGTAVNIPVAGGMVEVKSDNTVVFIPDKGLVGLVEFSYEIIDNMGGVATANQKINLTNNPPTAQDDQYVVKVGEDVVLKPLLGDSDNDGTFKLNKINGVQIIQGSPISVPVTGGTVEVLANDKITFVPTVGFVGNTDFNYEIIDDAGAISKAMQKISVEQPTINTQVLTTIENVLNTDVTPRTGGVFQTNFVLISSLMAVICIALYNFLYHKKS
jgi:Bacterial Ig domain